MSTQQPQQNDVVFLTAEPAEDQVIKEGVDILLSLCSIWKHAPVGDFREIITSGDFLNLLDKTNVLKSVNSSIAHMRWRVSSWQGINVKCGIVVLERVATDWEGFFPREIVDDLRKMRNDVVLSNFSAKLDLGDVVVDVGSTDLYRRLIDRDFSGLVNRKVLASTGWKIDGLNCATSAVLTRIS